MRDDSGTTQTDEELIRLVQARDEIALGQLIGRYDPDIWPMILARSRNVSDAEEIRSNIWIAVWDNIHRLRNVRSFRAWLWKIAYNACDRFYATRFHTIGEIPEEANVLAAHLIEEAEIRYREAQRRADVREAIRNLPEKLRDVAVLRYLKEWNVAEIAEGLDMPEGTVKRKCSEARAILRETLKPD